ncbi:hypothetical protein GCM10010412_010500 [Nonomuraea recticatena]|uniref:Uncharacterized protein n=2 Tax=Nonomuraea recticatena TaxID=46178 RepID=A0ABP6DLP2_9ACTN
MGSVGVEQFTIRAGNFMGVGGVMTDMRDHAQSDRFRDLPERPDPATWRSSLDEEPLPQVIAEPAEVGDPGLRPWAAPELDVARHVSDAIVRRRASRD